ncbi:ATP-binding protein [Streptomyces subrutilus]|uniref:ATP-binding protein n=1 Tax=Streptomyces subrutilus TaxID=36818 RepID=UPI0033D89A7F
MAEQGEGQEPLVDGVISASAAFEQGQSIAAARDMARDFLIALQRDHGLPVSERAMGMVELVVSELVTNARKYAAGPCLVQLEVCEGAVQITVWDSEPRLPTVQAPDPYRIGQHGLEIVMAVCRSFEIRREPVGKSIRATLVLADDPGGDVAGRQLM